MSRLAPALQPDELQLEIPCSCEFVFVARKAIESMCSRLPFTTLEVEDIALAVGEACANGVKFSSLERSPIRITCKLWPDKLEITVRNRGTAFGKDTDCRVLHFRSACMTDL